MREQDRVTLSDSEWIIMQEIWKRGEATFREICDGVAAHQWSKPAVAAFLKRKKLSKKEIDELAELIEEYGED